ncbi:MAG: WHG domain-containing protein [Hyphomicrobiales bacterium]|nr:WHG domain-containing protein [Hyphomicrobiales bacterium]
MKDGIAAAGPGTKEQVLGMCRGYIRFATEHNALFKLVFDNRDAFVTDPQWQAASNSARRVLQDMCLKLESGAGGQPALQVALHSLAHGYSKLLGIGSIRPGSGGDRDVRFEDVLALVDLRVKPETSDDTRPPADNSGPAHSLR